MLVLAIESSCDETAVAVVEVQEEGFSVRSSLVASQVALHRPFGGIVPEIASRKHVEIIYGLTEGALEEAGAGLSEIELLAVTNGPGLVGALVVGVSFAKALAYALRKPLVPVDHVKAHSLAVFLDDPGREFFSRDTLLLSGRKDLSGGNVGGDLVESLQGKPSLAVPFVSLVVSGGHTALFLIESPTRHYLLGQTRDDAAGEAFDKVAKLLNLGYPGGPIISRLAEKGDPGKISLPRPMLESEDFDFSFSGLKTAVLHLIRSGRPYLVHDLCAAFEDAVCEVLVAKSRRALHFLGIKRLVISGGVAANRRLRESFRLLAEKEDLEVCFPSPVYCTDNAAMVAVSGFFEYRSGNMADLQLDVYARSSWPRYSLETSKS